MLKILKTALKGYGQDECGVRAAALAYYTIFALPPLLILLITIAGRVWGPDKVQSALESQFAGLIGQSGATQVHEMIAHGAKSPGGGLLGTIAGAAGLILGATGAFLSLQAALNRAWEVKPDPKQGGIKNFITKRLLSLGMVFGLGFLLAVSLALSAAITALGGMVGSGIPPAVMYVIDLVVSLSVLTLLFACLFKFLPDAVIAWRDVWVGAFATAVLFVIGKFLIGLYLGRSSPGDAFGAASALAVVLVWVYYAGNIILFGAEFTQAWATERGGGVRPKEGAVRVIEQQVAVDGDGSTRIAASGRADAGRTATRDTAASSGAARGGLADWIIGLPALYFFFRKRPGAETPPARKQIKR